MMVNTSSSLCLHLLILVVFCAECGHSGMHNSPGETQPPRVEIKINSSANITCRMNLTKFGGNVNSSSLYFVEEDTGRIVPATEIEILNSTAIVFILRNAVEQDRNYICKSGKMGIGVTHVSVGTSPLDVSDFKCRGYDYTYMVCSFSIPNNVILTQYNLSYTAQSALYQISVKGKDGKSHNRTVYSQNYIQICPLEVQQNEAICNLTQGNYRENYEFFNFTLTGRNDVGINVQSFWINNYESVTPPRPEYIFENTTNNSVVIKWHNIKYSYYTAKGLQYEIRLKPRNRGVDWMNHSNYEIRNNRSEYKIIVRNIPFAYFWYELSLRVRVKKAARNDDSYWSEPYIQEFRTAACAPETAPLTDVGSFYIDPTETKIRLYWRQLPEYKENGPDFQYVIKQVEIDGVEVSLPPVLIDRTSAVFHWDRDRRYKFVIISHNAMGESPDNSTIIVPAWPKHHERSMSPKWIRNVYHANNITYTLSWNPPNKKEGLIDYTVFWCQSKRATPNECDDTIFFTHVDRETTRFNSSPQTQEQSLNLAVSANYREFNTGMHWTMCTADVTSDLAKMEPEIISTGARSITVQWSSDRVCSSLLEGYNLTYCRLHPYPISIAENASCLEEPITVTIPNTAKKYEIKGLKPFCTYKIEMLVFSKLKKGKMSDPQSVNTTEEAPSKPLHLKAVNITSNSAILTWISPEHRNGILRKYRIEYNNEHHIMDCLLDESVCSPKLMKFKLENLSSYTRYKVYVVAYTTSASKHSNDINVETLVGIPSNPRHIKTKENSHNILQWSRPEVPSGRVEFYQVAIIVWYKDLNQRQHISNIVGATQCEFHLPVCIDADYRFTMQVRAVNMAKRDSEIDHYIYATKNVTTDSVDILNDNDDSAENEDLKCVQTNSDVQIIQEYRDSKKYVQYTSVWEKGPVTNCSDTKLSRITMVALLVVVSSLGVMAAFYVARNKYLKMANISCALPPGLEAMAYPTKDNGDEGDFRRSKESFYNNESRHLLSSISHDSGYICNNGDLHNTGDAGIDGITPNSIGKSSGYSGSDHSTDYCNADIISDNGCIVDRTPTLDDAYMVMELLTPSENQLKQPALSASNYAQLLPQTDKGGYVQHSLSGIPALSGNKNTQIPPSFMPTENGYIKQMPAANTAQMIPSENGYIKPHNILNWSTQKFPHISTAATGPTTTAPGYVDNGAVENSTGYVGPHLLHKPLLHPVSNGYISLAALTKSADPNQSSLSQTFLQSDGGGRESVSCIIPPISGYVTQKELSAYAQQQIN